MINAVSKLFTDANMATVMLQQLLAVVGIPGTTLSEIDDALQIRFFKKGEDGKSLERWEYPASEPPSAFLRFRLVQSGFVDETWPFLESYHYAVWPGALVSRAGVRLMDLAKAWSNGVRWRQLVVLGGKRELQPLKEGWRPACQALGIEPDTVDSSGTPKRCCEEDIWESHMPTTELGMMKALWHMARIPVGMRQVPIIFVDAPMKLDADGYPTVRPTTEDTIRTWLANRPEPGSVLLSSGAPYGPAQEVALQMLLPEGFDVETFGHSASGTLTVDLFMREVAGTVNRIRKMRGV